MKIHASFHGVNMAQADGSYRAVHTPARTEPDSPPRPKQLRSIAVGPYRRTGSRIGSRPRPDVTVVTLSRNSQRYIANCVERTVEDLSSAGLTYEFYVIDNGSTDATPGILERLRARDPCLRTVRLHANRGTTSTRNLALRRACGEFICVLDSDAYPQPGCIERLIECLRDHPEAGLAAPKVVYPDGRYQKSTDRFPTVLRKLRRAVFLHGMEAREHVPVAGPVPYAISAFWLLRRTAIERVGLMDEGIYYSPEDVDYCLRLWKAGLAVWYEPSAVAVHDPRECSRHVLPNRMTLSHLRGLAHLFRKHHYFFRPPPVRTDAMREP